jgi:hypothetical protein
MEGRGNGARDGDALLLPPDISGRSMIKLS